MPRLPPVPISPHTRLRARFWPGVIDSVVTLLQSHSSSSATSWARPVRVPWPISERAMRMTQVLSGLITTQALTSASAGVAASADPMPALMGAGRCHPRASPPAATAVEPTMNARRWRFAPGRSMSALMSGPLLSRRHVHGGPDALVGPAATDVGHRIVDFLVGRVRVLPQQRDGGHDLAGLAVAALGHVQRHPGFLHGVRAGGRQALDGDDPVRGLHAGHGNGTGADDLAVEVHRAGPALRDAAAVLRPGEADLLADHPQERCIGLDLHVADLAVDVEPGHEWASSFGAV